MMRRGQFLALCAASALGGCQVVEPVWQIFASETGKANEMFVKPLRTTTFMTWNLRGVRDVAPVAAAVASAGADFAALLEAPGGEALAARARAAGLVPSEADGVALLSRAAPLGVRTLPLARPNAALLVADFPDCRIGVGRLAPDERACAEAVRALRALFVPDRPFFLAGDWAGGGPPAPAAVRALRGPFALLSGAACDGGGFVAVSRRHRARFEHVAHDRLPSAVGPRPVVVRVR